MVITTIMLLLLVEGIYVVTVEMASCGMIYVASIMKIGTEVQAILRFCLRNLKSCNVGIADGSDLELSH
jgi:hypothetical protein